MRKVLIPTKLDKFAATLLSDRGYNVILDSTTPLADLIKAHNDTEVLIVRSEKITPEIIDQLPQLKLIVRAGAGFNTIDIKYARKHDIDVMNTPGANSNAVAEEVVAMMLASCRHLIPADISTRAGEWEKSKFMGRELTGKTVGILGLGHIGQLLVKRLAGFEVKILGFDPVLSPALADKLGVELAGIERIFAESDFVTLHIPQNNETKGFVNKDLLQLMKNDATLINCARAGIVNEDDIRAARQVKSIRFLNDVYPKDAEGPKSVADIADLMMPHLGASTVEANRNAAIRAAEELVDLDEKGVSPFIVNRDIPQGLDASYCGLAYTLAQLSRALLGKDRPLSRIEISCYGTLAPFSQWLTLSLLNGIWEDIDRTTDCKAALKGLEEKGIVFKVREPDPAKHYDASMTVDLISRDNAGTETCVSVRGTVGENLTMIARIDEFNHLYWVPAGHAVVFEYKDRPGVIAAISKALASADVNIEDMRNPHNPSTGNSLALLAINKPVSEELVSKIAGEIQARIARCVSF